MANEVIKLAYDEARAALKEPDATLSNIRNRPTGLLAAAAVGTSFDASVGLLCSTPTLQETPACPCGLARRLGAWSRSSLVAGHRRPVDS